MIFMTSCYQHFRFPADPPCIWCICCPLTQCPVKFTFQSYLPSTSPSPSLTALTTTSQARQENQIFLPRLRLQLSVWRQEAILRNISKLGLAELAIFYWQIWWISKNIFLFPNGAGRHWETGLFSETHHCTADCTVLSHFTDPAWLLGTAGTSMASPHWLEGW